MATPILIIASFSVFDERFIFVSLIALFVILPYVLFRIHFDHLLSPALRRRLHWQQVSVVYGDHIRIHFEQKPEEESGDNADDDHHVSPLTVPDDEIIPWSEIDTIGVSGNVWAVVFKRSSHHMPPFMVIPYELIDDDIRYPLFFD